MAQELIASGFVTAEINGRYIMQYDTMNGNCDLWKHEDNEYYILRNSWHWMISYSCYFLNDSNLKAMKNYVEGSSPVGVYANPSETANLGSVAWE